MIEFLFDEAGAYWLQARAVAQNARGNGALGKIGQCGGILKKSFLRGGNYHDQALWVIIDEHSYRSKAVWGAKVN